MAPPHVRDHRLCLRADRGDVLSKARGVRLLVAGENRSHRGDADAGADVAHEIKEAGGIAHRLFRNGIVGERGEWDEDQSHSGALQYERPEEVPITDVQIQVCEAIERKLAPMMPN